MEGDGGWGDVSVLVQGCSRQSRECWPDGGSVQRGLLALGAGPLL